jgi:hypothetical protein
VIDRIVRDAAVVCVLAALGFSAWRRDLTSGLSVLGGGFLIGLSYWAIRGVVDALIAVQSRSGEPAEKPTRFQLVKFFTRYGMLALAAYVMMVRLHLDPVGLLAGVSSLAVAVAVEVLRDLRWRRFP